MQHLENILCPLLLRNDCVVIPALGGFVANYVSAKVDVNNGIILPPSKALSFNKNLVNNDGLIANYLAKNQSISYDEANSFIAKEVQQIKANLAQGKRVHFQNVGFLYLNNAGKVAFEQERFFNLLLSSYGLKNVQFVAEEEEIETVPVTVEKETVKTVAFVADSNEVTSTPEQVEEPIITHPAAHQGASKGVVRKLVRYAAVAALVPILFYSFWIPMKTDVLKSGILFSEDFNPFRTKSAVKYDAPVKEEKLFVDEVISEKKLAKITDNLPSSTPVFSYPLDEDLFILVKNDKIADNTKVENIEKNARTASSEAILTQNKFHLVVGCFGNATNATNLIADLKARGFDAYEVDVKGGLHRVSGGNAASHAEIIELRQQLTDEGLSSWVLKK